MQFKDPLLAHALARAKTITELLAELHDAPTFALLVTNSSVNMPPPKGDEGTKDGNDLARLGEGQGEG